jgi:hypothetical protein
MAHFWTYYSMPPDGSVDTERHRPHSAYLLLDGHAQHFRFADTFDEDAGVNDWDPATAQ